MPVDSDKFLLTQVGRVMAIHYEFPHGARRKAHVQGGILVGVKDRMMVMRVSAPGREDELYYIEQDADQPAFARHTQGGSTWWEWTSPQLPVPRDFKDE